MFSIFIKQEQLNSNLDSLFLRVKTFLGHHTEAGESQPCDILWTLAWKRKLTLRIPNVYL